MPLEPADDPPELLRSGPKPPPPMNAKMLRYFRRNLRFWLGPGIDMDQALMLPPGTYAACEAGERKLPDDANRRLRSIIRTAGAGGSISSAYAHVGRLIRYARESIGMTQRELAARCNLHQGQLSTMELAEHPRESTLDRIAAALGVTKEWILQGPVPLTDEKETGIIPKSPDSPTAGGNHG